MLRPLLLTACAGLAAGSAAAGQPVFTIQTPPALRHVDGLLAAVSALSPTDAWAVGGGLIVHFDGTAWRAVAASLPGSLNDVSAVAADDVWAAGSTDNAGITGTVAARWDGKAWRVVPTPPLTGQSPGFNTIAALSGSDVWAGGQLAVGGENLEPLFEHWNGTGWTVAPIQRLPGFSFIHKLAARAPGDIWAVGETDEADAQGTILPLIEHWDGTGWRPVAAPHVGVGGTLDGVVALAADDAWAVGSTILAQIGNPQQEVANPIETLVEHWDGKRWTIVPSPNIDPVGIAQADRLHSIAALSPSDIWAAGQFTLPDGSNDQLTLAEHWDGTRWSLQPVPDVAMLSSLFGAATAGSGTVWLVGAGDFPGLVSGIGPLVVTTTGG